MMPIQKPGRSRQDYCTPPEFVEAVTSRFGCPCVDLAASETNRLAPQWLDKDRDSLSVPWCGIHQDQGWVYAGVALVEPALGPEQEQDRGWLWLNPPYAKIEPWVKKCWVESQKGCRILTLIPASTGSNWFSRWVWRKASILWLSPRLTFVGEITPYPKDCMLLVWDRSRPVGESCWRWDEPDQPSLFPEELP